MQSRAPGLYLLDERTRLAGCHMIRDAVERLVLEEGVDTVKQFMREAIEDGRRDFKRACAACSSRAATARSASPRRATPTRPNLPQARAARPDHARRLRGGGRPRRALDDRPARLVRVGLALVQRDARGPAGDAVDPVHADADLQRQDQRRRLLRDRAEADRGHRGRTSARRRARRRSRGCRCSAPRSGYLRAVSRALQSRGYIEEIVGTYTVPGNVAQGGGIDQYGQISGFMNFEIGAQGQGAKYVLDGLDYGAAVFNPEGDMGDIEMWELVKPMIYLGRRIKPNTGGLGPAPRRLVVRDAAARPRHARLRDREHRRGRHVHLAGTVRRLPGAQRLRPQRLGSDIYERAAAGEAYPVADVSGEDPQLNSFGGEHDAQAGPATR